jgi:hypothetical protein
MSRPVVLRLAVCLTIMLVPLFLALRPDLSAEGRTVATQRCVFVPMVRGSGRAIANASPIQASSNPCELPVASPTATRTAAPTPSHTPTVTPTSGPPSQLSGSVRFQPIAAGSVPANSPRRVMVVLDVSGSMSANFEGQCNNNGQVSQCEVGLAGSPPAVITDTGRLVWWNPAADRRITIAKTSINRLIKLLNMPGNQGYTNTRPPDELGLVWFNDQQAITMTQRFSSDPAALRAAVLDAGRYDNDPYRTSGGTNGAAGLYRAKQLLDEGPMTEFYNHQIFTYTQQLIYITDGVATHFLDTTKANLAGGASDASTFLAGSVCAMLGSQVLRDATCQTTAGGGLYNGWNRPLTQLVQQSNALKESPAYSLQLFAIALSNIPATGLRNGVATVPLHFYAIPSLQRLPDGTTNLDLVMEDIYDRSDDSACRPSVSPFTNIVTNEQLPVGVPGLEGNKVGEVSLVNNDTATEYVFPISFNTATRELGYAVNGLPPGQYTLSAYLFFKGSDGVTRGYTNILKAEQSTPSILIDLTNTPQQRTLELLLNGDVCAVP